MPFETTIDRLPPAYASGADPAAVVAEVYDRIAAAGDPGLFISIAARDTAIAAANHLGPFDPAAKPLWGIPFAVKDNIDVAGLPTTAGCPAFAYQPPSHATCVQRLVAAGAIPIGKTNLDQFATGLVGTRTPYPIPRNPLDPALVPGGSSSGSAVAVARGILPFALGTDTAGSGRVPAGLNNIVGLKPSCGAVSTRGVVPACRSLDCVSVFALTVADAWRVYGEMVGTDAADPYSRPVQLGAPWMPPAPVIGVPAPSSREFCGDTCAEAAYDAALADLAALGATLVPVDLAPFRAVAALLYEGPWVAERYAAVGSFLDANPGAVHPVVRDIIAAGGRLTAADTFAGLYQLAALKGAAEAAWAGIDCLALPTAPTHYTLAEVAAEPLALNARLGTYTNFVNLLDLCALAVPGRWRADARPAGVTLIGRRGDDGLLAGIGARLHAAAGVTLGATPLRLDEAAPSERPEAPPRGWIELVVVGAHLSGLALNHELRTAGAVLMRAVATEPCYRLFALPGGPPQRPGLLRVAAGTGAAIATEVWALPAEAFGRFVAGIPAPLSIGTLRLADGTQPKGFLVEAEATTGAADVSRYGGWRAYLAKQSARGAA